MIDRSVWRASASASTCDTGSKRSRDATARACIAWYCSKLEGSMDSVRSFVRLWAGLAVAILAYATLDLRLNPWLYEEHAFTMRPDLSQLPDLLHWGGRLLKESAFVLLASNALVIAGLLALLVHGVMRLFRRGRSPEEANDEVERISVFPQTERLSVPPPG